MAFIRPGRSAASAPSGDITPSLVVEYVDTSGNRQTTTVVDGVTSITVQQYSHVHFDATESRSAVATTLQHAWSNPGGAEIGYRINYGEALGGTWSISGASKDEDTGPPIFSRVFTTTGTKTVRLRCKDTSGNEATISMSVVVNAIGTVTTAFGSTTTGAWPTFVSNGVYTLDRSRDYSARGDINLSGLHNVIFYDVDGGVGSAMPIVGFFRPDTRGPSTGTEITDRARNCRMVGIDVAQFGWGSVACDFPAVINGRVRMFKPAIPSFDYYNGNGGSMSDVRRNNCRFVRGVAIWNCGELNDNNEDGYVLSPTGGGAWRKSTITGTIVRRRAGSINDANCHTIRQGFQKSSVRHTQVFTTNEESQFTNINNAPLGGDTTDTMSEWTATDDYVGVTAGGALNAFPNSQMVWHKMLMGDATEVNPGTQMTSHPSNTSDPWASGSEYVNYEDIVAFEDPAQTTGNTINFGGRYQSIRNCRQGNGTGTWFTMSQSNNASNIPSGWDGPYSIENANTRPVPTAF